MRVLLSLAALSPAFLALACTDTPTQTHDFAPAFDEAPVGACPAKFTLSQKVGIPPDSRVLGRDPADDNGDGYQCVLFAKGPVYNSPGDPKSGLKSMGVVILIDNSIPPDQVGKCPVSFTALTVYLSPADINDNTVVCSMQTDDAGLVTTDDNDR